MMASIYQVVISFLALIPFLGNVFAYPAIQAGCSASVCAPPCCQTLYNKYPSQVSFPNETLYTTYESDIGRGYWSTREAELIPTCRFLANSPSDISAAVRTLTLNNCTFAVRSGGYMQWPGAANINDGVTIDLSQMNEISISADNATTKLGPGNRWRDVYHYMDPLGLAVTGGRVSPVGVGGYLVGGGMSFFASQAGFSCDNVLEYEVVLANGTITYASATQNSNLFMALKGGNNNFGIVSSFLMKTYEIPNGVWGGTMLYSPSTQQQQIENFFYFGESLDLGTDLETVCFQLYFNSAATGVGFIANVFANTAGIENPPILSNFTAMPNYFSDSRRNSTLESLTTENSLGVPAGHRELLSEVTFRNDLNMLVQSKQIFDDLIAQLNDVPGFAGYYILQSLSKTVLQASKAMGGNSLGLSPDDGNLIWCTILFTWDDASFDTLVDSVSTQITTTIGEKAKELSVFHPFIYLNYATQNQDPISSYGPASVANLQAVAAAYDPYQVFQTLLKGGFKLPLTIPSINNDTVLSVDNSNTPTPSIVVTPPFVNTTATINRRST